MALDRMTKHERALGRTLILSTAALAIACLVTAPTLAQQGQDQTDPYHPQETAQAGQSVTGTIARASGDSLLVRTATGMQEFVLDRSAVDDPQMLEPGARVRLRVEELQGDKTVTQITLLETGGQPSVSHASPAGGNTATAQNPQARQSERAGRTLVGTVIRIDDQQLVLETEQGRRVIRLDRNIERPDDLRVGTRIAVLTEGSENQLVATRLSTDPDNAEFMTFASPERGRAGGLPATASQQALAAVAGLLLLSVGVAVRGMKRR